MPEKDALMPSHIKSKLLLTCLLVFTAIQRISATTLTVGGFFNVYDAGGNVDKVQLEHLSAFELAIAEINANSSFLPGVTLNTIIRSGLYTHDTQRSADFMHDYDVAGVIGAIPNLGIITANSAFNDYNIAMIQSVASDVELGYGLKYKYSFQTNPIDSFRGTVMQRVLCDNKVQRVIVFVQQDDTYLKMSEDLASKRYCDMDIYSVYTIPSYQTNFDKIFTRAKETKVTTYVILMSPALGAAFVQAAYDQSLLYVGTSVIGNGDMFRSTYFLQATAHIAHALQGFLTTFPTPEHWVTSSPEGDHFMQQWKAKAPTSVGCSSIQDSVGYHYYYHNGQLNTTCTGLNFTTYNTYLDMDNRIAMTYDAVYALAHAFKRLLQANIPINGESVSSMLGTFTFDGASGFIRFASGDPKRNYYNSGVRDAGMVYTVFNYQLSRGGFVPTQLLLPIRGLYNCTPDITCYNYQYNTEDNKMSTGYTPFTFSQAPAVVRIGGIFQPYNTDNLPILEQLEVQAAFVMAVRDVNDKLDGVYDDLLPDSEVRFSLVSGYDFSDLVAKTESYTRGDFETGVRGAVVGLYDQDALVIDTILQDEGILQVGSVATDTNLADGTKFPIEANIPPVDSYRGLVIQDVICNHYGYRKIAILATDDGYGTQSTNQLKDGSRCQLTILSQASFSTDTTDFSPYIDEAKVGGATVFVLFISTKAAAKVIFQGYNAGIFKPGTILFGATKIMSPTLFSYFPPSFQHLIPEAMKGFVGVDYWPGHSLTRTDEGKSFYQRWRQQASTTTSYDSFGAIQCNQELDDASLTYLYRHPTNSSICYGLNFTSYDPIVPSISTNAVLTYDATIALLHGIHYALQANGGGYSAFDLINNMVYNMSYQGVTGKIELGKGNGEGNTGLGSRVTGLIFKIRNFNHEAYINSGGKDAYPMIAYWSSEDGMQVCGEDMVCVQPVYNSATGEAVADIQTPIIITMDPSIRAMLYFFGALVWVLTIVIAAFIYTHKESKLMKASQLPMMYFMLLGEFLGGARVIVAGLDLTDQSCTAGLWMGHLAFFLVFGCLFIKTWRVHKLVNSSLKRVKITIEDVLRILAYVMAAVFVYMLILTFVGNPHLSHSGTVVSNQETLELRCGFERSSVHTTLFAIEALVVIMGTRLCYAVKDVPDAINESKYIAMAITSVLMISTLAFPVIFLLNMPNHLQQVIASVCFAIAAIATMSFLFVPKAYTLLYGDGDIDANLKQKKKNGPVMGNAPIAPTMNGAAALQGAFIRATVAMKRMNLDERVVLCKKQLEEWEGLLMQQLEMDTSDMAKGLSGGGSQPGSQVGSRQSSVQEHDMTSGMLLPPSRVASNFMPHSRVNSTNLDPVQEDHDVV